MSGQRPKVLLLVFSNCADPSKEDEFNEWYTNVHVPDVLQTPGAVSAQRYRNVRPGKGTRALPKYLALYEIESEDPEQVFSRMRADDAKREEQGRMWGAKYAEWKFLGLFEPIGP
jgi:hypothetical protein